uniref:Uncharacterized protein n=1 Tax=Plectus sambesii TaxID=2011161 RepID=A0A914VIZ0_9BILA
MVVPVVVRCASVIFRRPHRGHAALKPASVGSLSRTGPRPSDPLCVPPSSGRHGASMAICAPRRLTGADERDDFRWRRHIGSGRARLAIDAPERDGPGGRATRTCSHYTPLCSVHYVPCALRL